MQRAISFPVSPIRRETFKHLLKEIGAEGQFTVVEEKPMLIYTIEYRVAQQLYKFVSDGNEELKKDKDADPFRWPAFVKEKKKYTWNNWVVMVFMYALRLKIMEASGHPAGSAR